MRRVDTEACRRAVTVPSTGTSVWIDPRSRSFAIFLSNRVHPDGKGDASPIRREIATLFAEAMGLEEPMGALLTAAGHKGYALSLVCDLLGSALFGGTTAQPSRLRPPATYNNMLAIVFDPARFGAGEHFEQESKAFIDYVQSAKRTDANAPIEIPGDAERRYRRERAQAMPVDTGTGGVPNSVEGLSGGWLRIIPYAALLSA